MTYADTYNEFIPAPMGNRVNVYESWAKEMADAGITGTKYADYQKYRCPSALWRKSISGFATVQIYACQVYAMNPYLTGSWQRWIPARRNYIGRMETEMVPKAGYSNIVMIADSWRLSDDGYQYEIFDSYNGPSVRHNSQGNAAFCDGSVRGTGVQEFIANYKFPFCIKADIARIQ